MRRWSSCTELGFSEALLLTNLGRATCPLEGMVLEATIVV